MYTTKIMSSKPENGFMSSPGKNITALILVEVYIGIDLGSVNYSPWAISSLLPVFVNSFIGKQY